jgi:hypothetical protein
VDKDEGASNGPDIGPDIGQMLEKEFQSIFSPSFSSFRKEEENGSRNTRENNIPTEFSFGSRKISGIVIEDPTFEEEIDFNDLNSLKFQLDYIFEELPDWEEILRKDGAQLFLRKARNIHKEDPPTMDIVVNYYKKSILKRIS